MKAERSLSRGAYPDARGGLVSGVRVRLHHETGAARWRAQGYKTVGDEIRARAEDAERERIEAITEELPEYYWPEAIGWWWAYKAARRDAKPAKAAKAGQLELPTRARA